MAESQLRSNVDVAPLTMIFLRMHGSTKTFMAKSQLRSTVDVAPLKISVHSSARTAMSLET